MISSDVNFTRCVHLASGIPRRHGVDTFQMWLEILNLDGNNPSRVDSDQLKLTSSFNEIDDFNTTSINYLAICLLVLECRSPRSEEHCCEAI